MSRRKDPNDNSPANHGGDNVRASWRYSTHDVVSNCKAAGYDETESLALRDAFTWCIHPDHPVRFQDFCKRVDYDPTTVNKIFTGKYYNTDGERMPFPKKLLKNIHTFLELEQKRNAGGKNEFILTPTARRIWTACDLARESQTPVFLWGPSHIGKTWALESYVPTHNHGRTVYIRMEAASGLGGMVRNIATGLGISDKSNTANLLKYIKNALSQDLLLVLDELHLLQHTYRINSFFNCLEVIRELFDRSKCGMVLCGTRLLLEKLKAGEHKEMEQLMRRGVHRIPLPAAPTVPDLTAIFKASGLEFPGKTDEYTVKGVTEKPYEILRQISKRDGLLAVCERLRYARKLANKSRADLDWKHYVQAHLIIEAEASEPSTGWE